MPVDSTPDATASQFAMSSRILASSLMGALVLVGVALFFVLGSQDDGMAAPMLVVPLVQVAAGFAVHLLLESIGYRAEPLDPSLSDEEAARRSRTVWQSGMVVRFAVSEALAMFSLVAAFVIAEGGYITYLVGAAVSLALMFLHVWPGPRPVGKVADSLEQRGQSSHLRQMFGVA